jgi:hypothetical protein
MPERGSVERESQTETVVQHAKDFEVTLPIGMEKLFYNIIILQQKYL